MKGLIFSYHFGVDLIAGSCIRQEKLTGDHGDMENRYVRKKRESGLSDHNVKGLGLLCNGFG